MHSGYINQVISKVGEMFSQSTKLKPKNYCRVGGLSGVLKQITFYFNKQGVVISLYTTVKAPTANMLRQIKDYGQYDKKLRSHMRSKLVLSDGHDIEFLVPTPKVPNVKEYLQIENVRTYIMQAFSACGRKVVGAQSKLVNTGPLHNKLHTSKKEREFWHGHQFFRSHFKGLENYLFRCVHKYSEYSYSYEKEIKDIRKRLLTNGMSQAEIKEMYKLIEGTEYIKEDQIDSIVNTYEECYGEYLKVEAENYSTGIQILRPIVTSAFLAAIDIILRYYLIPLLRIHQRQAIVLHTAMMMVIQGMCYSYNIVTMAATFFLHMFEYLAKIFIPPSYKVIYNAFSWISTLMVVIFNEGNAFSSISSAAIGSCVGHFVGWRCVYVLEKKVYKIKAY